MISSFGPTFTVVICAHDMRRLKLLRAAIQSVLRQTLPPRDVVVICDHNPELLGLVAAAFPQINAAPNTGDKGLSGARNTGVALARGDCIAFIDDDAEAEPDWLQRLADGYTDPAAMAVGGAILPVWPEKRPHWWPAEFDWVIGCSYTGLPAQRADVRNLIGCNMSMRKTCLDATGGFKTGLGRVGNNAAGCEETEVFIRMRAMFPDRTIVFDPRARVHHAIDPARTRWRYFAARCRAEGRAKAIMARSAGLQSSVATEATYVRKTLPKGVARGLADLVRGDPSGPLRAGAIVLGLSMTSSRFLAERLRGRRPSEPDVPAFQPRLIVEADIADGLPELSRDHKTAGTDYGAAWCLIREAGQPISIFEMPFDGPTIAANKIAQQVADDPSAPPAAALAPVTGTDAPHVTVVIATRDRCDSLARCLDSLLAQTYPVMDIVVVDNAPSSRQTRDLIATTYAAQGKVTYVREATPGLGRAHNAGVALARGDIVAFTDDDVIADADWVAAIAANFAHDDSIGCVTGLIVPAELETRAQYWTECHGGFGKGLARRVFDPKTGHIGNPLFPYAAGSFGSGANMAFRRDTLKAMGGFDPSLGAGTLARGGDDLASFVAVLQCGDRIAYEPGAIVWHHHRRSEDGMQRQAFNYGVGLGAYLTKQIVDDPRRLAFFVRKLPAAMRHLFSAGSSKMKTLPDDYPRRYVWSERWGILMGVPAYLRSRHSTRRIESRSALPVSADLI